jgi:hypothetical protein
MPSITWFILAGDGVKLAGVEAITLTLIAVSPASRQRSTSRASR